MENNCDQLAVFCGFGEELGVRQIRKALALFDQPSIRADLVTYREQTQSDRHCHENMVISVMLGGTAREEDDYGEHRLAANSCSIYPAGQVHSDVYGQCGAICLVYEIDSLAAPILDRSLSQLRRSISTVDSRFIDEILRALWNFDSFGKGSVAENLLDYLVRTAIDTNQSRIPDWVTQVHEHLSDICRKVSIESIAQDIGKNRCHLVRAFKRYYGVTPSEYRLRNRVAAGVNCLQSGESISGAAAYSGFADASHFARNVRRFLGVSPSVIQERSR